MTNDITLSDGDDLYDEAIDDIKEIIDERIVGEGELTSVEMYSFVMAVKSVLNEHNVHQPDREDVVAAAAHELFREYTDEAVNAIRECEW